MGIVRYRKIIQPSDFMFENKNLFIGVAVVVLFLVGLGIGVFLFASPGDAESIQSAINNENSLTISNNQESGSEILGDPDAPVKIVEFSDPECYYCQSFHVNTFSLIKESYIDTGKVSFEYKHYPLPAHIHPNAQKAAEAIECATEQGKRWDMIDKVFTSGSASLSSVKNYASDLGLNEDEFNQCLDSGKYYDLVQSDLKEGKSMGVGGTPTFFINGQKIEGAQPFSVFQSVIESKLN